MDVSVGINSLCSTTTTTTTSTTTTTTTTTTVVLLLYLCARNVYEWKHYIVVYSSCIINGTNYFYAPLEKRGILFCNCRSVGRSVDQVLSSQYLLTPSRDQYQTWCRGCPLWFDDRYWFSGYMFKCQGQTTLLRPLCCPLNIFWPLHLINTKLNAGFAPNK